MKDRLEQFISEHCEEFDVYEPRELVWSKLESQQRSFLFRILENNKRFLRIAAAVLIFLAGTGVPTLISRHDTPQVATQQPTTVQEKDTVLKPEKQLNQTEQYYQHEVSLRMKEVDKHLVSYPELKKNLKGDFNELDSIYSELKHDLKDGVANEEVIEAMVQNYKTRLQILEDLLYQLKKSKKQKDNNTKQKGYEI